MWGKVPAKAAAALLAGCFTLGCASPKTYLAQNYVRPQKMAVLPMANETTDLDGPPFVRQLIFKSLASRGYTMVPMGDIDANLLAQGFSDGGQLNAATPQKVGEWVKADGLLYTTLVNFSYINLGYYWQRKVTIFGRLVSATTGEKLWEDERTWMTLNVVTKTKDAQKQFLTQLGTQALEKTLHVPLQAESLIAVKRLIDTLP